MIKQQTVTLCTIKKEKQVLVHRLYKNEKTRQREAEVLPQLQVHYEDLLISKEEGATTKTRVKKLTMK
jgi:hypothetical protein